MPWVNNYFFLYVYFSVGLHKKIVSTMLSNSSSITHHYEIGDEFRGYAAKMTHE